MASQITATLPALDFPKEVDYPTQEDWAAFSAAAEENFGILGGDWSTQMQLWKTEANAMSIELNNSADIAQSIVNYKGDWISQGYALNESVSVDGIYYICKLTHATGQNPTDVSSLYWNLALGNWNLKVNTDMSGYTSKSTPVDADLIPLSDSVSSFGIKKLSWANVKATLKTYFDTLYVTLSGNQTVNGIKTFTSNIVGNITGNAGTATTLATGRTINGVSFDGSTNISVGLDAQDGVFSIPFTLNTTHKNRLLLCDNGITITLPTINTIRSGDLFYITNGGLAPLTLALNGNSTNLNTLKITGGETLIIQSDGGSYYRGISRKSTPVYDFDTNLIAPLGYNTVYQADTDLTLIAICTGEYMNGAEIVIGTTTSPTRVVAKTGDNINNNTKWATLTAVIPAGLYFKVQGFGGYAFEVIEITAYKHK